jgi:hypothetical protein
VALAALPAQSVGAVLRMADGTIRGCEERPETAGPLFPVKTTHPALTQTSV